MHTYTIALYFQNHNFAAEESFKAPKGTPTDVVLDLAAADYAGFIINNQPVYVGSASA
jgi:hypothetical protein